MVMPSRQSTKTAADPSPWSYTGPSSAFPWMKAEIPSNAEKVLRWDEFQVGDIVYVQTVSGLAYGMIVDMFHHGEQRLDSVIAWVYKKAEARKWRSIWPHGATHLITNHFQLINNDCLVKPARRSRHVALVSSTISLEQGLNISIKQVDTLERLNNDVNTARDLQRAFRFLDLPTELQQLTIEFIRRAEHGKDATIKCKAASARGKAVLNSSYFWGIRNASKELRALVDNWLLDNKPIEQDVNADWSSVSPARLKTWNGFTTSFRHVYLNLRFHDQNHSTELLLQLLGLAMNVLQLQTRPDIQVTLFLVTSKQWELRLSNFIKSVSRTYFQRLVRSPLGLKCRLKVMLKQQDIEDVVIETD